MAHFAGLSEATPNRSKGRDVVADICMSQEQVAEKTARPGDVVVVHADVPPDKCQEIRQGLLDRLPNGVDVLVITGPAVRSVSVAHTESVADASLRPLIVN